MKRLNYNLDERFEPSTDTIAKLRCVWSFEGQDVIWGRGNNRKEARVSALETAQIHRLMHRPRKVIA